MENIIKPVTNEKEYDEALNQIELYFDAEEGTAEANIRDVLSILIEKYEEEQYPIDLPDPIEAIRFRMDQQGLIQKDLERALTQFNAPPDLPDTELIRNFGSILNSPTLYFSLAHHQQCDLAHWRQITASAH